MKSKWTVLSVVLILVAVGAGAFRDLPARVGGDERVFAAEPTREKRFDNAADTALVAMKKRAEELKIGGVAVVAYFEGDGIQSWSSKMVVVTRMKDAPAAGNNGSNLLGIAYAKAAEMADTLQNSGSNTRPPMTGEFGWQGGVIGRTKAGHAIAAFSGGKSEDDVEVSKAGLAVLEQKL